MDTFGSIGPPEWPLDTVGLIGPPEWPLDTRGLDERLERPVDTLGLNDPLGRGYDCRSSGVRLICSTRNLNDIRMKSLYPHEIIMESWWDHITRG